MKKKQLVLLLIIVVLLSIGITAWLYSMYLVEETRYINMGVIVGENMGFSVDTDSLEFGKTKPGAGGLSKSLVINHKSEHPLKVTMETQGEVKDWVSIGENNFILQPGETKRVFFSVSAPEGTPFGNYTGRLKVVFKKVV